MQKYSAKSSRVIRHENESRQDSRNVANRDQLADIANINNVVITRQERKHLCYNVLVLVATHLLALVPLHYNKSSAWCIESAVVVSLCEIWCNSANHNFASFDRIADMACANAPNHRVTTVPGKVAVAYNKQMYHISSTAQLSILPECTDSILVWHICDDRLRQSLERPEDALGHWPVREMVCAAVCHRRTVQGGKPWSRLALNLNAVRAAFRFALYSKLIATAVLARLTLFTLGQRRTLNWTLTRKKTAR